MKQNAIRAFMAVAVEAIELAFDSPHLTSERRKQLGEMYVWICKQLHKNTPL